jgi:mitotic-spindle organizing protein 1
LNCGLDQRSITILVGLIENGVNPEALSAVVKELKRETAALRVNTFKIHI